MTSRTGLPREHLRAVVWPREPKDGPEGLNYRYVLVGMLVTDKPLQGIEGARDSNGLSETVLDSTAWGLSAVLEGMPKLENASGFMWGTADSFLASLELVRAEPRGYGAEQRREYEELVQEGSDDG